jgi:periplasmic protein CpxP/Spy
MKILKIVLTVASVLLAVAALSLVGCSRHGTPEERVDRVMKRITKQLDLNDQQVSKLEAVKQEVLAARSRLANEQQKLFDEVIAQVQADRLDQTKVFQLLERRQELQRQAAPPVVEKVAEFHASLTPEQKAKAVEHLRHFREKMGHHAGM